MSLFLILLVFFGLGLLYLFYRSVSGTPSEDALWSVLALTGVYQLLKQLPIDWGSLTLLTPWIVPSVFVCLLVIFADDFKRLLYMWGAHVNLKRFIQPPSLSQQIIDEVVEGVQLLSRNSIGALIVIRQRADLSIFVRGGVDLDARIHSGLLYSLFIPDKNNHLHDGAVVIEGERLTRAATYLPMTRTLNLENHLGTRHRAALGISEETDAIVIVVSEERGTVSIAYGGRLNEDLDARKLKHRLHSFIHTDA